MAQLLLEELRSKATISISSSGIDAASAVTAAVAAAAAAAASEDELAEVAWRQWGRGVRAFMIVSMSRTAPCSLQCW